MAKRLAVGAGCGILWGVTAGVVFAAMRGHLLPAPHEVALPLAVALVFAYLPFIVAVGLEVLLGRSSHTFAEVIGVTIACGLAMGLVASWLIALARRGPQK